MSNPKNPEPGALVIDASDVDVVDITPEQIMKLVKLRDGAEKAMDNLLRLKPVEIARAGVSDAEVARALALIAEYRRIEALLPAVAKLLELLHETRLDRGHKVGLLIAEIAMQARRRGERDPQGAEILGPLEDLLAYQYGPAIKAAATRGRVKAAAKRAKVEVGAGEVQAKGGSPQG